MGSATARGGAVAGLLLVLALGGGALPAAVADDATPAPSASAFTTSPSPSGSPSPTPSETTTPTPDPTPSATTTPTRPVPEPTPSPRPTPSATRSGPPPESQVGADGPAAGATIVIGEFDCRALTALATITNLDVSDADFAVSAFGRSGAALEDTFGVTITVPAGATRSVSVPLAPDAYTWVDVRGPAPEYLSARREGSCGSYRYEPEASVGAFDCSTLSVPVVLDNRASTRDPAVFEVLAYWRGLDITEGGTSRDDNVEVAAGESLVVTIQLHDDALNTVEIRDWGLLLHDPEPITGARSACGQDPRETPRAAGSGSEGDPAGRPSSASLAATGADGILPLLAAGLALVALGAGMVGASRLRTGRFR